MSESLKLLTKNDRIARFLSKSLVFWAKRSFAHIFAKNEQFAQKTDEQIPRSENTVQ